MTTDQVRQLVEDQIAGAWEESNHHGVCLRQSLVAPTLITVIDRQVRKGKIMECDIDVWLVLIENPSTQDGYRIVYSEAEGCFGLASQGFETDPHPVLCGWYGDFMTTFKGM